MKTQLLLITMLGINNLLYAQEGIWRTYTHANSDLIGDTVMSLTFDAKDSVWIGAWQGVAKQDGDGWEDYNKQDYMPSNEIWDMDYANGSVWVAHHDGITGFNGTTWTTFTTANSGLVNAPCFHLAHSSNGDLWIATARGLGKYSSNNVWSSFKKANTPAMPYDGIEALATSASNDLWMSFIGTAGLVVFPAANSANARYIKQDSIPGFPKGAVYIKSLAVDHAGNLWAGTQKHGVVRINATGASVFSRANTTAIRNDSILSVTVDKCGNVWIGTEGGAAMYNGNSWTECSKATGHLLSDHVYYIKANNAGHVWLGTKGGVTEFRPLPKVVTLLSPLMNMTMNNDTVICSWERSCPGITKYWFEYATNEQFAFSTIDTISASLIDDAARLLPDLQNNTTYYWRVRAKNDAGWSLYGQPWVFHVSYSTDVKNEERSGTELLQNYPNPCSALTTIEFATPGFAQVRITLYDALGRERGVLFDERVGPGRHAIDVDVSKLGESGNFIYRFESEGNVLSHMMQVVQ